MQWTLGTAAGSQTLFVERDATPLSGTPSTLSVSATAQAGSATQLVFATPPSSAGTAGSALGTSPSVQVADTYGNPVTGTNPSITLAAFTDSGCTISASGIFSATSNPVTATSGVASFSSVSYTRAQTVYLRASASGLTSACSNAVVISPAAASALVFSAEPPSSATAGAPFASAPEVSVHDAYGNVVTSSSNSVTLAAFTDASCTSAATGTLGATSNPLSASSGVAAFSAVTYNQTGTIYLRAQATGLSSDCSTGVTIAPAAASRLSFVTEPSASATAGSTWATQPAVEVLDTLGNRVNTATHAITLAAFTDASCTTSSGTAVQATTNPLSASAGLATFAGVRYDRAQTIYLRASASGLTSDCSTAVAVSAASASVLAFTTAPSTTATAGSALSTQPVVEVRDAYGNVVPSASHSITLGAFTDASCSSAGTGTLSASSNPVSATSGSATFSGVSYHRSGSLYLSASAAGVTGVCSSLITVSPAAASQLVYSIQPSSTALLNAAFGTQPAVAVHDAFGNVVTGSSLPITLAAFTDASCTLSAAGSLSATTNPLSASTGVAQFAAVQYNAGGVIYLGASGSGVTAACSNAVTVNVGPASRLAFTTAPSASATAGVALSTQPTVTVQDDAGNTVFTATNSITLAAFTDATCTTSASGTFAATTNPVTASAGIATFSGVNYTRAETIYLRATATGLTSACSSAIAVSPAAASQLSFSTQPAGPAEQNENLPTQPIVRVLDAYGNLVTGSSASISLSAFTDNVCSVAAAGTVSATTNPLAASSGVSSFSAVRYSQSQAIYIGASSAGLTSACSGQVFVGLNLEVPIELLDIGIASNTSATTWERSRTSLDTGAFVGQSSTYRFEAVCQNSGSSGDLELVDSAGTSVGTLSITGSTTVPTRFETTFTPTTGASNYRLRTPATGASNYRLRTPATGASNYRLRTPATGAAGDLRCFTARIKVQQVAASATRIYIPLVGRDADFTSTTDGAAGPNISSTTSNSYGTSANPERIYIFRKDTNLFSTLSATNPWTLEVVASSTAGTPRVQLYNLTAGASAGSEATGTSAIGLASISFANNASNFTEDQDFEVRIRRQGGSGSNSATLYKAGLWLSLTNLSRSASYYRIGRLVLGAASTTVSVHGRTHLDTGRFDDPSVRHIAVGQEPSAGTTSLEVLTAGTSESGTSGSAIASSAIDFASTSKTRMEATGLTLPAGDRFIPRLNVTSGTITGIASFLVVEAQ